MLWQLDYYENGGVTRNQLHHMAEHSTFYLLYMVKIIVPSSRLAIWHVQFVAVSRPELLAHTAKMSSVCTSDY